jgi:hypothetical protein
MMKVINMPVKEGEEEILKPKIDKSSIAMK